MAMRSMGISQQLVYTLKGIPVPEGARKSGRWVAGIAFDLLHAPYYKSDGMVFEIPHGMTNRPMRGRLFMDTYELPERSLVKRHLPRDATVLELGGCLGIVSCTANRMLDRPERHVVVEANPHVLPIIEANRARNRARFSICGAAVVDVPVVYYTSAADLTSGYISPEPPGLPIPGRTITQLEQESGLQFDSVIIDIEGGEQAIIEQNAAFFRRLRCAIIEFTPTAIGERACDALRSRLTEYGLRHVETVLLTEAWVRDNA